MNVYITLWYRYCLAFCCLLHYCVCCYWKCLVAAVVELSLISLHWFLTMFASVVHTRILLRLWDLFFYEGSTIFFQVTLGMLKMKVCLLCQLLCGRKAYARYMFPFVLSQCMSEECTVMSCCSSTLAELSLQPNCCALEQKNKLGCKREEWRHTIVFVICLSYDRIPWYLWKTSLW